MKIKDELIQAMNNNSGGKLWNALDEDEKRDLLIAYDESFDENNLLNHEHVKLQHEKWLIS